MRVVTMVLSMLAVIAIEGFSVVLDINISFSRSTPRRSKTDTQTSCGAIDFDVTISPPLSECQVMQCDCSICTSHGYLLVYPYRADVVFHGASESHVQKYQFHTKKKDHWFCRDCGTSLLIDFNTIYPNWDVMAVNVR